MLFTAEKQRENDKNMLLSLFIASYYTKYFHQKRLKMFFLQNNIFFRTLVIFICKLHGVLFKCVSACSNTYSIIHAYCQMYHSFMTTASLPFSYPNQNNGPFDLSEIWSNFTIMRYPKKISFYQRFSTLRVTASYSTSPVTRADTKGDSRLFTLK